MGTTYPVVMRPALDRNWCIESAQDSAELIAEARPLIENDPVETDDLLNLVAAHAGYLSVADPLSPDLLSVMAVGSDAASILFACGSAEPGATVSIPLSDGRVIVGQGTGPTDMTYPGNWLRSFWFAVIGRLTSALDILAATPLSVLRASPTETDEYYYRYVDTLAAVWRGDVDLPDRLIAALDATEESQLEIADPDFVLDIIVPQMEILYRMIDSESDSEDFNEALAKALRLHHRFWTRTADRRNDPDGYIAWGPLALAIMARDNGISIEVTSDYLPTVLLNNV